MRKFCLIFLGVLSCIDAFSATARSSNTNAPRQDATKLQARQTTGRNTSKNITNRPVTQRASTKEIQKTKVSRSAISKTVSSRTKATNTIAARVGTSAKRVSRAATTNVSPRTFGSDYNTCRDAYFTCMDQFCANQNDSYRRCVCSSRLQSIQGKERSLSQTSESLQDFHDFNIDSISKTAEEVKAMQSATAGEQAIKEDNSASATTLKNIKDVLKTTRSKALSTNGTLDIGGDIKSVWQTTDLIQGYDIANLSGEALYNAVHAQCSGLVAEQCVSSDLKIVASAYGMYIENDCALLSANVDSKVSEANAAIRASRHEMQDARLENYDAHNSLSLNDCIANVRKDITANSACGENYVHCLDFTGKYLNATTGEPIYSVDFYGLENQLSLSGDVLKNSKNTAVVTLLKTKQPYAQLSLDLCRDVATNVWDEFLRQAITEIYQRQRERVQKVKQECLNVVNKCYLNKSETLKEYSEGTASITSRQTLELSEELCSEKLTTCSNLYGGGADGMETLIATMTKITDNTIAQDCPTLLQTYIEKKCAVSANDSTHAIPYGCRFYAPGEARYARVPDCNKKLGNPFEYSDIITDPVDQTEIEQLFSCAIPNGTNSCISINGTNITYTGCNAGYYLYELTTTNPTCPSVIGDSYATPDTASACCKCPETHLCYGDKNAPIAINDSLYKNCGSNYVGSLYQMLTVYALNNCTRTSNEEGLLPDIVLADVDKAMTTVRASLLKELATECESLNGVWMEQPWQDSNADGYHDITGDVALKTFYDTTHTHKLWGYCKKP